MILASLAFAGPESFVLQGQIIKPNGETLENSSVNFNVKIYSPGANNCLLFEENFNGVNMTGSAGLFQLAVGKGTRSGSDFEDTSTLDGILKNSGTLTPSTCISGGPNYTPNATDERLVRLTFNDGSGAVTLAQDHVINSVPYAQYAKQINGIDNNNILQVNLGSAQLTQANLETVFSGATDANALRDLIDGDSTDYISSSPSGLVDFNSQRLTDVGTPTAATDATNKTYVDSNLGGETFNPGTLGAGDTGEVLTWDGSQWVSQSVGAGDILDGGNSTGSALSLGTNDTQNLILETDGTAALTIDAAQGVSLASGLGVTGGINAGSNISLLTQSEMRFEDTADGEYVGFRAPSSVTTSTLFTLPDGDGTANQVLSTDGSGQLVWATDSNSTNSVFGRTGVITAQTSDYDAIQVDNTAAGDITATNVQAAIDELDSEKLPKAGGTLTGNINLDNNTELQLSETDANGADYVGFKSPADLTNGTVVWELPDGDGTSGQILQTNGSGVLSWVADANTTFTPASGDYTASEVDNVAIGNIAATDVQAAINELDIEKLPLAGGTMTGNVNLDNNTEIRLSELDANGTDYLGFRAPADLTNGVLVWELPDGDGTTGQLLQTDGSGVLSWSAPGTGVDHGGIAGLADDDHTQYALLSGRSGGQNIIGGTDSGDDLTLDSTSNATKGDIILAPNGGNVGVGTTAPSGKLDIEGGDVFLGTSTLDNASANEDLLVSGNLEVEGEIYGTINSGSIITHSLDEAYNDGSAVNVDATDVVYNLTSTQDFHVRNNGIPGFTVDDAGRVGIGTEVPTTVLDVEGQITVGPRGTGSGLTGSIILEDLAVGGIFHAGLRAPDTLAANLVWTLPSTAGGANNVLSTDGSGNMIWAPASSGVDHGSVAGLTDDDHTQYTLLTGRSGGQYLRGGTDASDLLVIESTSHATKGNVTINQNGGNVGIGTSNPNTALDVEGRITAGPTGTGSGQTGSIIFEDLAAGGVFYTGLKAPDTLAGSLLWTLPSTAGGANDVLSTDGSGNMNWTSASSGVDHGSIAGLIDDDHSQYALLNGRAGGQSLFGGTAASADLTLESTSNATKGDILLAPNGGNVGIGTTSPSSELEVVGEMKATFTETGTGTSGFLGHNFGATYSNSNYINTTYSFFFQSKFEGTATTPNLYSLHSNPSVRGSGTITNMAAIVSDPNFLGTAASNVTNVKGIFTRSGSYDVAATSSIDSWMQIHVNNPDPAATPTNAYGLLIDNISSGTTLNYSIYSSGGDAYFGGNMGIGDSTPDSKLDVKGRITSGPIDATAGNTGSIIFEDSDTSNFSGIRAADVTTADYLLTLPATAGSANQVLSNTATPGVLAWTTPTTGTGDFKADGSVAMTGNLNLNGQSLIGGTASGDDVTIESTTNATKGDIILAPNAGNVGVGTAAPNHKLEVAQGIGAQPGPFSGDILRLINNDDATDWAGLSIIGGESQASYLDFGDKDSQGAGSINYRHDSNQMQFRTNGTDRMFITSAGKVGLGTSSPSGDLHLNSNVLGSRPSIKISQTASDNQPGGLVFDKSRGGSGLSAYDNLGTITYQGLNSASVPKSFATVTVQAESTLSGSEDGAYYIDIMKDGAIDYNQTYLADNSINFNMSANDIDFQVKSDLGSALFVKGDDGNVGIGTTTPSQELVVWKNQNAPTTIEVINNNTGASSQSQFALSMGSDYLSTGLRSPSFVGFGALGPGDGALYGNTNLAIVSSKSTGVIKFGTGASATERVRIDSVGYMGVGTTTPGTKLDIAGALSVRETAAPAIAPADQGRIYFDSTAKKFRVSEDNGTYVDLLPVSGAGSGDFMKDGSVAMTGNIELGSNYISGDGDNEGLVIGNEGTVGIGTTVAPSASWTKSRIINDFAAGSRSAWHSAVAISNTTSSPSTGNEWVLGTETNVTNDSVLATGSNEAVGHWITAKATNDGFGQQPVGVHSQIETHAGDWGAGYRVQSNGDSTGGTLLGLQLKISDSDIDTAFGIYIEPMNAANTWGIYDDSGGKSYFKGNIGVGTTAPSAALHVQSEGSGQILLDRFNSSTYGPNLKLRKARGTQAATTASQLSDLLGAVNFEGHDGSDFTGSLSRITSYATENHSPTNLGSDLRFSVTPTGTASKIEALRMDSDGNVGIGTTVPAARLHVRNNNTSDVNSYASKTVAISTVSSSSYREVGGAYNYSYNAISGAGGNFSYGVTGESESSNDGNSQIVVGVLGTSLIHSTDVGYGLRVVDNNISTGGTMYGLHIELDDSDIVRRGIWQVDSDVPNYFNGNVGIGTTAPAAKLHVDDATSGVCVTSDGTCSVTPGGGEIAAEMVLNTGADYAEYFEAEENLENGDLVGLNPNTGLVRGYKSGDQLLGVVSTDPGVVGNSELKNSNKAVLVALVGQVPVIEDKIIEKAGTVYTKDGQALGYRLGNGNIYLNLSSGSESLKREMTSLKETIHSQESKFSAQSRKILSQDAKIIELETEFDLLKAQMKSVQDLLGKRSKK